MAAAAGAAALIMWSVLALASMPVAIAAVIVGLMSIGRLTVDVGWGRRIRPLGPQIVRIEAPPEMVFDQIAVPYLSPNPPRELRSKIDVLERGADMVIAAHRTKVGRITTLTVESVTFQRPHQIAFRLLRGPVPFVVERFRLETSADGAHTDLHYTGKLGTDLWGARLLVGRPRRALLGARGRGGAGLAEAVGRGRGGAVGGARAARHGTRLMAPSAARVDRDEVFLEYAKSICPICKRVIDGEINVRDGRVLLRKRCPEHGPFEALVYSDADLYMSQLRYNKPGTLPLATQTEVRDGCPLDCGMCPDHKQHSCLGLIEVNSRCNLDCPICFAGSGHQPDGFSLTAEQVGRMLDAFVAAEGEPEVVQFSGGEPTIHPEIVRFIEMAKERGIKAVMLNTNGIRIALDDAFVAELARVRPHIYLQFDGLEERTHLALRGRDLREVKQRALDRCAEAGLTVTLVAAVEKGVNEHEIGEVVRYGVRHPAVMSVAFQPVTHSGRHMAFDPLQRLTNADVMKALAAQVPEWFRLSDFVPVPCCFPTCRSMCYAIVDDDGLLPLARLIDVDKYLDYVSNRMLPDPAIRGALERMFSASALPGAERALLACEDCGIDLPKALRDVWKHFFIVAVQDFQDPYTLNVRQLMKCCVAEIVPDGRIIPFCAYNSVGYREQVRASLTGIPVAPVVPNAIPLAPLLRDTPHGSKMAIDGNAPARRDARNVGKALDS